MISIIIKAYNCSAFVGNKTQMLFFSNFFQHEMEMDASSEWISSVPIKKGRYVQTRQEVKMAQ